MLQTLERKFIRKKDRCDVWKITGIMSGVVIMKGELLEKFKDAYYNLVEEVADVLIIIAQLKEIYGISDSEIQKLVDFKCARQEARINESDRRVSAG